MVIPARPADNETITSAQADYDTLQHVATELPCPYLPGVDARNEAYLADKLDGAAQRGGQDYHRCVR